MYNKDIQEALSRLDQGKEKRKNKRLTKSVVSGFAMLLILVGGVWLYQFSMPSVSVDQLSRLIIIASRTSDNDPIRMLGDVERHMGKKVQDLSNVERANAMNYLMNHIELHHNRQEMISY